MHLYLFFLLMTIHQRKRFWIPKAKTCRTINKPLHWLCSSYKKDPIWRILYVFIRHGNKRLWLIDINDKMEKKKDNTVKFTFLILFQKFSRMCFDYSHINYVPIIVMRILRVSWNSGWGGCINEKIYAMRCVFVFIDWDCEKERGLKVDAKV